MSSQVGEPVAARAVRQTSIGEESLLDRLVLEQDGPAKEEMILPSGRKVLLESPDGEAERITVRSPGGAVELEVELTGKGPLLRFKAAGIAIESEGAVEVRCDEFKVEARRGILERSGGDIRQEAAGDASLAVKGDLSQEARICSIRALRGDVRIAANDDVRVAGERVRLNC